MPASPGMAHAAARSCRLDGNASRAPEDEAASSSASVDGMAGASRRSACLGVAERECDEARHEQDGREVLGEAALLAEAEVLDEDHGEQLAALEHQLRGDIEVFEADI